MASAEAYQIFRRKTLSATCYHVEQTADRIMRVKSTYVLTDPANSAVTVTPVHRRQYITSDETERNRRRQTLVSPVWC